VIDPRCLQADGTGEDDETVKKKEQGGGKAGAFKNSSTRRIQIYQGSEGAGGGRQRGEAWSEVQLHKGEKRVIKSSSKVIYAEKIGRKTSDW